MPFGLLRQASAILSGDHMKIRQRSGPACSLASASLYQLGYFRQHLNADGWQQNAISKTISIHSPVQPPLDEDGRFVP